MAAQRVLACAVIQGITIALFAVGWWGINRGNEKVDRALATRGVVAQALVVASEPSNHNLLQYRFTVAGRSYLSADFAATVDAKDYPVGSQVRIVYDRAAPATTCVCNPRSNLRQYSLFSVLVLPVVWAAAIGPMIIFQFGRWRGWWIYPSALYRRGPA